MRHDDLPDVRRMGRSECSTQERRGKTPLVPSTAGPGR
jgi:hypothetical protein